MGPCEGACGGHVRACGGHVRGMWGEGWGHACGFWLHKEPRTLNGAHE